MSEFSIISATRMSLFVPRLSRISIPADHALPGDLLPGGPAV